MRALDIADCINETCPWSGKPVQAGSLTEYDGHVVGFCNSGCRDKFESTVRYFEEAKASQATRVTHCAVGGGRLGTAFKLRLGGR